MLIHQLEFLIAVALCAAGYWRSGDIGSIDAEGNVFIHDRLKDLINRAGYKVYSAEVEAVLGRHPKVIEAAVVGRPDPVLGERVHAFIAVSGEISEVELHDYCALKLSDYKVPETWTISAEILPRTSTGKLAKKTMRESLAV